MTSAALDVGLCLLLISAAAVTVTSAPGAEGRLDRDRSGAVAETLTATTADVPYRLDPVPGSDADGNPEYDRVAHGTVASLLADVAVRTVHVDREALTGTNDGFATAVRETVAERLPDRTRVVVRWAPVSNSHVSREFAVGPTPPPDADVHAETVRAPSGVDAPTNASAVASAEGYDGLGRLVADAVVDGLLPPEKGRLALGGDAPIDDLVRHRYRRVSDRYGVDTVGSIERGDTHTANRRIAAAMGDRFAADLRRNSERPRDAAASLELDTVEISVRTWSP
ncbi:MAG: DUF7284 family protein [Halolamina sp.]